MLAYSPLMRQAERLETFNMAQDDFTIGTDALRRWYWSEVRSLAREAVSEHPHDEEARREWVDETCDAHEFLIYTYKAQAVLLASDSSDAYEEEFGAEEPWIVPKRATDEVRAFWALRADVLDQIEAELPENEEVA